MNKAIITIITLALLLSACGGGDIGKESAEEKAAELPEAAEAVSLLGEPLYSPEPSAAALEQYQDAKVRYEENPNDADAVIWYGRRAAYLGQYREAIDIFTEGITQFPEDARFYRHRGHRYISVREFDNAVRDLEKAGELVEGTEDKVEPDGMPNAQNIPLSTLHTNIWYHLGLAYYLQHEFDKAAPVYHKGIEACPNNDMLTAFTHWAYMTYRRLGQKDQAAEVVKPIHADMEIIENQAYHQLCLLYEGERTVDELYGSSDTGTPSNDALAYGIGNWYFYNGVPEKAEAVFRAIIDGGHWASFGCISAETELAAGLKKQTQGALAVIEKE
jgi:tetratricopeptide (TPR) repeat protein